MIRGVRRAALYDRDGLLGGSLTQQQVANAYPGIYQGLLPTCSFPDTWTSATQVGDYHLLRAYFEDPSKWGLGVVWTPLQFAAVEGNPTPINAIVSDIGFFAAAVPTNPCGGVTDQQRYDPQTNPGGVRCGIADYTINVFGPRPPSVWSPNEQQLGHGFAGLAIDNVGVQYGLAALQQGMILPAQFVDLNVKIGGVDIDIVPVPQRLAADEPALANAYRSGAINETTHLDQVAIIDGRGPDPGAAHDSYRTFAIRARLDREHGSHANHVIWEGPTPIIGDTRYTVDGLIAIDRWLAAVEQDHSDTPLARKIVQDKPADINDRCSDGNGNKVSDGLCPDAVVPVYGTPRTVVGHAITTDANKCQLKPLNRSDDYGLIPFTDDQWAQMEVVGVDRLARSVAHCVQLLDLFRHLGITFISLREGVDSASPLGSAVLAIVAALAQLERDLIRSRVVAGLRRARLEGVHLGRKPLDVDRQHLERVLRTNVSVREGAKQLGISPASFWRLARAWKEQPVAVGEQAR